MLNATASRRENSNDKLDPESLLRVSLVKHTLDDTQVKIKKRRVDLRWYYEKLIPVTVVGFNPLHSSVYIGSQSWISQWLDSPHLSARSSNPNDLLMREVTGYLVHDYLHSWAYLAINEICPELGFGVKQITKDNFEDFVFCHLLTESVATVGLDYWHLCTLDLNKICNIGTNYSAMATAYKEKNIEEYRRLIPGLEVQSKEFFIRLSEFYCTGDFYGIRRNDAEKVRLLRRSPMSHSWINHELKYGTLQREYTRLWLSYLAEDNIHYNPHETLSVREPWKQKLMSEMAELLWEKVKKNYIHKFSKLFPSENAWTSHVKKEADFRFINYNSATPLEIHRAGTGRNGDENFKYLFYQYVSTFSLDAFDLDLIKLFENLIQKKDMKLVEKIFKDQKRIEPVSDEPRDLFLIN